MDFEGFKEEIHDIIGIDLSAYKERQMKRRIDFLLSRKGIESYETYIKVIKSDVSARNEFVDYIAINVSEFYRNPSQWHTLEDDILPGLLIDGHIPRVWSAACASGEEPYSLVMALNKYLPLQKIRVDASDIDVGALQKAQQGIYPPESLKNLSDSMIERYFDRQGDQYKIHNDIKACVDFKRQDLLKDSFPHEYYDLILCRNVMIYFTEEAKAMLYKKFRDALTTDGVLFVGGTEQIILPHRFGFVSYKPFFYKKADIK